MKIILLVIIQLLVVFAVNAQQLLLLDRFNDNRIVNDSTITVFISEAEIHDITQYFTMKNNTDKKLAVFLRKTINIIADSTTDYYCFGIRCWPGDDSTNVADTIPPGGEDFTFASHVTHQRRFDLPQPILPLGLTSITYTVYDKTSFPEPVEASVTVIYHHSGLGVEEAWGHGGMEAWEHGGGEAGRSIRVYPNPAKDWVTLEIDEIPDGISEVFIFNNLGANVRSILYNLQDNQLRFSVSGYTPGLYLGRIVTDKGSFHSFRFQVSR
jgi:hypothetical protein